MKHSNGVLWVLVVLLASGCSQSGGPFPYMVYRVPGNGFVSFAELKGTEVRSAAIAYPKAAKKSNHVPISLTASDGTGLELLSVRAKAVVEGPLAFTELSLVFRNPTKRRLEGRFRVALPAGASVSRFAMRVHGAWQEAEVVERQQARQVYESYLHQGVDPALLEASAGNAYRARIFPIAPRERKEIILSYSHELASPEAPYVLPLAGLPALEVFEVNALTGLHHVRSRKVDWKPDSDLVIAPDDAPDGLRADDMVIARVTPTIADAVDEPGDLLVLFDTSASSGLYYYRQVESLADLLGAVADRYGDDLRVRVVAFDQVATQVFEGGAGSFGQKHVNALLMRRALGASNLSDALAAARTSKFGRVLLVSDGIATAGPTELGPLRKALAGGSVQRIDALAIGISTDHRMLAGLTAGTLARDGVVLDPEGSGDDWASRLGRRTSPAQDIAIEGAEWVWPRRLEGMQPGDSALVYAKMAAPSDGVTIDLAGDQAQRHEVQLAKTASPLVTRAFAKARIDRLLDERGLLAADQVEKRDALASEVVGLSMQHRVVSPLTALLVLETDQDYARFGLARTALSDLLSVDATGVRVLSRGGYARATTAAVSATPAGTGAIAGTVTDLASGQALAGVTVVATSPVLSAAQSAITDTSGNYQIDNLPPGRYAVTGYYGDQTVQQSNVQLGLGVTARIAMRIDSTTRGEVIEITGRPPNVDVESTQQGATIDADHSRNVPTGRTFNQTLGTAPGSKGDSYGVSFAGSSSLENNYIVDGINTTRADDMSLVRGTPRGRGHSSKRAYAGKLLKVMKLIERGDTDGALIKALQWYGAAPTDLMALLALGEALEARGCFPLAARVYGSIIDLYPSRADMRRVAAGRLARLGPDTSELLIDDLNKAVAERPDHPTGYRMLAYAHAVAGQPRKGVDVLLRALGQNDPRGRFGRARALLLEDVGLIAAAWLAASPADRNEVRTLLAPYDVLVPMDTSLQMVLSWEADATDVNLYVTDQRSYKRERVAEGHFSGDVTDGFGPEAVTIVGHPSNKTYHLWAHYTDRANRGTMGYNFGQVQVVLHDGAGKLTIDTRPFVVMGDNAHVDLGVVTVR